MEKKKGLTRIVVCLYSNDEFVTRDDANFKLTQEVQEIENQYLQFTEQIPLNIFSLIQTIYCSRMFGFTFIQRKT